jgi:hypothetical protein
MTIKKLIARCVLLVFVILSVALILVDAILYGISSGLFASPWFYIGVPTVTLVIWALIELEEK